MSIADWTTGEPAIKFQRCTSCQHAWAFEHAFCPHCGDKRPVAEVAAGSGHVYSVTRVDRAPTPELKALAPYTLVLIDLVEGVRVMAHADADMKIGDGVRATFRDFGGKLVPYFVRNTSEIGKL